MGGPCCVVGSLQAHGLWVCRLSIQRPWASSPGQERPVDLEGTVHD